MPKKKRPSKAPQKIMVKPPVLQGNVFATFLQEAQSIGNEVEARRKMQNEMGAFLAEKGLVDEFNAWLQARQQTASERQGFDR
jgi:hypothetical protein